MKAETSRDIELQVRMVHSMKSPKDWNSMEYDMLNVYGEIERQ